MISANPEPSWIKDGEKYAIVGLNVQVDARLGVVDLPGGLTVLPNVEFELPDHWRDWLGTLRSEEVEECTLFLVARGSRMPRGEESANSTATPPT
jgi:hypothetical protein